MGNLAQVQYVIKYFNVITFLPPFVLLYINIYFTGNQSDALTFKTKSGDLVAKRLADRITISLPQNPPSDKVGHEH